MNYYKQGDAANADKINAAFKKLGYDTSGHLFNAKSVLYFTLNGKIRATTCNCTPAIIKTHPDYKELELPTKPNFKVGDWVVTDYGKVSQVVSVDKDGDGYTLDDGVYFSGSWCVMYHHWDIQDVKDGDVLTDGKNIVIFNKFEEPTSKQRIIVYAGLDLSGKLQITEETKDSWRLAADRIMPATKERRDLLFQKMKEAGYQWDADNKKLHKIQPHYDIKNFHAGMPVLVRDGDNKKWLYTIFGMYNKDNKSYPFVVVDMCGYVQCIPFNDDTKHLLGTTDPCDEQYINW